MIYLLDTHTFLWLLKTPEVLPRRVRELAKDKSESFALSLATPWEMAIKTNLGKLEAGDVLDDFDHLVAIGKYIMLDTTPRQAIHSGRLPRHHGDPFDRLLIAQALDLNLPILSSDDIFDSYGVRRVWK